MSFLLLETPQQQNDLPLGVVTEAEAQRQRYTAGPDLTLGARPLPPQSLENKITPPEVSFDSQNNPDIYDDRPVLIDDPPIILGKGGTTSQTHRPPTPTQGKLVAGELWHRREHYRDAMVARLKESGDRNHWQKLQDCHTEPTYCRCTGCGRTQVFVNRCDLYYCPLCQPNLEKRRTEAVTWWFAQTRQPKHIILTVTNTRGINKGLIQEMRGWFSKLRRHKIARNWQGGFYSIQCTNKGNGWHLHIHAVISTPWVDVGQLSNAWSKINGGYGTNVAVRDARKKDVRHDVVRYVSKGSSMARWNGATIREFLAAFDGVRCFGVFGNLFAKRAEWKAFKATLLYGKPECECGCSDFRYYDRLAWAALEIRLYGTTTSPP
jgi:hypothetical protein